MANATRSVGVSVPVPAMLSPMSNVCFQARFLLYIMQICCKLNYVHQLDSLRGDAIPYRESGLMQLTEQTNQTDLYALCPALPHRCVLFTFIIRFEYCIECCNGLRKRASCGKLRAVPEASAVCNLSVRD